MPSMMRWARTRTLMLRVSGVAGQEGECLVAVDAVPLHQDADRGADVGAGVQRLAELFDLFGVPEQGSGLGGEELGDLYRGAVECSGGEGVQVEPRPLSVVQQLDAGLG